MNKNKIKTSLRRRGTVRSRAQGGQSLQKGLVFAVLRSFLAGVGTTTVILCLLSVVFAKTDLPLNWMSTAACGAAAMGTFVSGLVLSRSVARFRLLMGVACGVFYCLCSAGASLLSSRVPLADETNLSLLAVLMLGAVAGSAAGALQSSAKGGIR